MFTIVLVKNIRARYRMPFIAISNKFYVHDVVLQIYFEVTFKLRRLADKKGPDEEDFNKLAASLDEFISRLFDPLKSGGRLRDVFLSDSIDNVIDAAIGFKQKNVSGN